jgi:hypothetical protein
LVDVAAARRAVDLAYGALSESPPRVGFAKRRLIDIKNAITVAPPRVRVRGALVVTAGNMDPQLLWRAGVRHVAVELTAENLVDFATARWVGFTRGLMHISRGAPSVAELDRVASAARPFGFLVCDTESHKTDMGGRLEWTDTLYAGLRSRLGPGFRLFNVTFGINSSPLVVNHDAFRQHNVIPVWEAYDGDGRTLGVRETASKAAREGWEPPHVCLGDKSLEADVAELAGFGGVGDVWLWASDNGPAQESLRKGLVLP